MRDRVVLFLAVLAWSSASGQRQFFVPAEAPRPSEARGGVGARAGPVPLRYVQTLRGGGVGLGPPLKSRTVGGARLRQAGGGGGNDGLLAGQRGLAIGLGSCGLALVALLAVGGRQTPHRGKIQPVGAKAKRLARGGSAASYLVEMPEELGAGAPPPPPPRPPPPPPPPPSVAAAAAAAGARLSRFPRGSRKNIEESDEPLPTVGEPYLSALGADAPKARKIRAGQRARQELEDSGWISDEDREEKANAILAGRMAERRTTARAASPTFRRKAYRAFLAQAQLCRQALDEQPSARRSLLDIHFDACLKLKELRMSLQDLDAALRAAPSAEAAQAGLPPQLAVAATASAHWPLSRSPGVPVASRDPNATRRTYFEPIHSTPRLDRPLPLPTLTAEDRETLEGARQNLNEFEALLQEWEDTNGSALKEAHERDAQEVLKRAGLHFSARNLDSSILTNADHAKKHRLLSKQEEIELGMKIKDGHAAFKELSEFGWKSTAERSELAERIAAGQTAKSYLALMNMRLVASIARSVYKSFPAFNNTSLTFDDLMQEGDVGLLEAIDRYDATKGFRFSTYATWWIRQAMRRSIFNKGSTIRIPIQRSEQIRSLRNASAIFEMENDRPPTAAELAKILKVKEQTAQRVMDIAAQGNTVVPLDKVRRGRQESVLSNIRDRDAVDPLEKLQREEETKRLTEAVAVSIQERLTKEEVVGIGMRYGLYGHEKASFREIADVLGVSSEKSVRKMISNGIQKIKRSVKSNMPSGNHGYDGDVGMVDTALLTHRWKKIELEKLSASLPASLQHEGLEVP